MKVSEFVKRMAQARDNDEIMFISFFDGNLSIPLVEYVIQELDRYDTGFLEIGLNESERTELNLDYVGMENLKTEEEMNELTNRIIENIKEKYPV